MQKIAPAIIPKNIEDIRSKLALLFEWGGSIQLDIMDGIYVPEASWPYNQEDQEVFNKMLNENEGLPYWENFSFEFDLMVKNASLDLDIFLKLGATRIVFHPDAEDDQNDFFERLEAIDLDTRDMVKFGVALRSTDSIESIRTYIPLVDFVQCMGIEKIGYQGEPFDSNVLTNIRMIKKEFPDIEVTVDGGVNLQNKKELIEAGADRLVVGSAIWKSAEPLETIFEFENI